jgi:hypothetical protein
MNKKYIKLVSGAAALATFVFANAFAVQAPISEDLNTDLQLTRQSTVSIVDQQSPVLDDNGNPVIDTNGNEETYDVTSVNLDLFYTYDNKFKSDLLAGIANQGNLNVALEPAGFCSFLGGGMRPENDTEPFEIPLGQLRKGPGLAPLLTTYLFEGLTGPQFIVIANSIAEALNPGEPAAQPIPPADSQGGFNDTPFANVTMSLTLLNAGELTLDGITDVSEVLGVPQGKVDLVMTLDANDDGVGKVANLAAAPAVVGACLPNVTPTITIVPVAPRNQPAAL